MRRDSGTKSRQGDLGSTENAASEPARGHAERELEGVAELGASTSLGIAGLPPAVADLHEHATAMANPMAAEQAMGISNFSHLKL